MRSNIEGSRLAGNLLMEGNKLGTAFQLLGATYTMDAEMQPVQSLDPGGSSRTVLLPAETKGLWFLIVNTADVAGEVLTIKEDSNTTTIVTLGQDESAMLFCTTNEAGALEWRAISPSGVGDSLSVGTLTVTSSFQGGDATTDTVGFFGTTPVVQIPYSGAFATPTYTSISGASGTGFGNSGQIASLQAFERYVRNTLTRYGLAPSA